jgi:exosome complex RNA-binding protein Rrp4
MSGLTDIFPDDLLMKNVGDDITYQRGNVSLSIKAKVKAVGDNSEIPNLHTEIRCLKAALPFIPQRGDTVIGKYLTFTVDSIKVDDDVYYVMTVR